MRGVAYALSPKLELVAEMGIDWSLLYNCGLRIFCLAWMPVEMLRGFLWFVLVFYALARVLANMEGMERPSSDCSAGR
ncbi:hypothetical protein GW17_00007254 [Ensete ventricosum]|nr:hypothetical protein GW17_00007254 [Ensete ventricosum]